MAVLVSKRWRRLVTCPDVLRLGVAATISKPPHQTLERVQSLRRCEWFGLCPAIGRACTGCNCWSYTVLPCCSAHVLPLFSAHLSQPTADLLRCLQG